MGSNYDRNLFKHLEEMFAKVDQLTNEVGNLKTEHRKETETMKTKIQQLEKENTALKTENQTLKDMLNKNSSNSSKPPSSDGYKKIPNSREKTGKRPGGQKGHKGSIPMLFDNPSKIEDIKQLKCKCGGTINYSGKYKAKQLVDIEIKTQIVEYREHEGVCGCCCAKTNNRAPVNDIITYGSRLKSFSSMLSIEGMVSINRIKQMLSELTGGLLSLSDGTIAKWNKDLSGAIQPAIDRIKEKLVVSPVLHKDETGIRINKTLHWLHVLGNKVCTLYLSHPKRGIEADEEMGILPMYSGVLMHDHLKGLYKFTCSHAECNAHILRYLKAAIEGKQRKWAEDMIKLLLEAKGLVCSCNGKPPDLKEIQRIHRRYDKILEQGRIEFLKGESPNYNGEDMKLLRRLREFKAEHLRFVSDVLVPFDNNQAERDLRMIKAKAKISGCFRADDGGIVFARLKSYTSSLRKNNLNIFDGLLNAFQAQPFLF